MIIKYDIIILYRNRRLITCGLCQQKNQIGGKMTTLMTTAGKTATMTSLEIVEQINIFRKEEGNTTELGHNDILKVLRDEFDEEISLGKISQSKYTNSRGREYDMLILTFSQAKQVLMRESKFVRKAMVAYIEHLEGKIRTPQTYKEALLELVRAEEEKEYRSLGRARKYITKKTFYVWYRNSDGGMNEK